MKFKILLILLLLTTCLVAQEQIEYKKPVSALYFTSNIPNAPLGVGFVTLNPMGFGVGMDVKITGSNIANKDTFIEEMTDETVGASDTKTDDVDDYSSLNVHLNFTFRNNHSVYLGAGHVWKKKFLKYERQTISNGATYWYESSNESNMNAVFGYIHRLSLHDDMDFTRDLLILIGYDLMPSGVSLGVGINIF